MARCKGRCADKCMNAGLGRMAHGFGTAINIFEIGTGKAADHGVFAAFGDVADGLEVPFRGDWESGLNDVHAHIVKHFSQFKLFGMGHGCAGALLTVTQSGVENIYTILGHRTVLLLGFWKGSALGLGERPAPQSTLSLG